MAKDQYYNSCIFFSTLYLYAHFILIIYLIFNRSCSNVHSEKDIIWIFYCWKQNEKLGREWLMNFKKSSWICKYVCFGADSRNTSSSIMLYNVLWHGHLRNSKWTTILVQNIWSKGSSSDCVRLNSQKRLGGNEYKLIQSLKGFCEPFWDSSLTTEVIQRLQTNFRKQEASIVCIIWAATDWHKKVSYLNSY